MHRTITQCESPNLRAGDIGTWKFSCIPATSLPKGTQLKFDMGIDGKMSDWETPDVTTIAKNQPRKQKNVIWAQHHKSGSEEYKCIPAEMLQEKKGHATIATCFLFTLPDAVEEGDSITICVGSPSEDPEVQKKDGNRARTKVKRRYPFALYIDPKGKKSFTDPELFHVNVLGNELDKLRVIAPSLWKKGKSNDLVIRFEDKHGNLTSYAHEDTEILFTHGMMRRNLTWNLYPPESGYISHPNTSFTDSGSFFIKLTNKRTKEEFYSDPILCDETDERSLLWGRFHGESRHHDSSENIESFIRRLRDQHAFQFFATSTPESEQEIPADIWKKISEQLDAYDDNDRFSTLAGFTWSGKDKDEGIKQLVYTKTNKPLLRKKETKNSTAAKIFKAHPAKDLFAIPSFTMFKECSYDFKNFDHDHEIAVEIYNAWGSSETHEADGNRFPIKIAGKKEAINKDGSIINALNQNCRFAFVAGGRDDRGPYSKLFDENYTQYPPGMTAVLATEHSREKLIEAVKNRKTYATTGPRIILTFNIAKAEMGDTVTTIAMPGLKNVRLVMGHIAGTDAIESVEIIRNGKVIETIHPEPRSDNEKYDPRIVDIRYLDTDHINDVALKSNDDRPNFVYYYLRITQKDGNVAWSSPIWIDHIGEEKKKPAKKKAAKSTS